MSQETIYNMNVSSTALQPIRLQKGDTLIVMLNGNVYLPDAVRARIHGQFKDVYPENDIIVLDVSAEFAVVTSGEQPPEMVTFDAVAERAL